MRILIVDDSEEARFCLREQLGVLGHSVVGEAENLRAAVAAYEKTKPELVMLDLTLEREDGIAVLKALQKLDAAARVVMLSANDMESIKHQALSAGASGYLVKPVDDAALQNVLGGE